MAGVVLNTMDDPRHGRIRRLVSKGISAAAVRSLEDELRRRMRVLLDSACDEFDFLVGVAAELRCRPSASLLGIPESDRHLLFEAVEHIFDIADESDVLAMTPRRQGHSAG